MVDDEIENVIKEATDKILVIIGEITKKNIDLLTNEDKWYTFLANVVGNFSGNIIVSLLMSISRIDGKRMTKQEMIGFANLFAINSMKCVDKIIDMNIELVASKGKLND